MLNLTIITKHTWGNKECINLRNYLLEKSLKTDNWDTSTLVRSLFLDRGPHMVRDSLSLFLKLFQA